MCGQEAAQACFCLKGRPLASLLLGVLGSGPRLPNTGSAGLCHLAWLFPLTFKNMLEPDGGDHGQKEVLSPQAVSGWEAPEREGTSLGSPDTKKKGNLGHICEGSPKILISARCLHQPQGNLFALQDRA